jgi:23S rRNA (cytosine1962-C5)-methyltransferase
MIPCVLFEDEHLLVVNKPAGLNTHAPGPYAGEGIYDWLKHREPRWAKLAIIHRLDKETSGVMVFGKTALANRSLTAQFASRTVRKKYLLLTDRSVKQRELTVESRIVRAGERYISGARGEPAATRFRLSGRKSQSSNLKLLEAEPLTGRTHQVRVHAAESGFPILGDALYGGSPWPRVCLHAVALTLQHPASGEPITFAAPADFDADCGLALRAALIAPEATNACRLIHGASDGWPGWYVDRLGDFLLSQSERALTLEQARLLEAWVSGEGLPIADGQSPMPLCSAYHKLLVRPAQRAAIGESSPQLAGEEPAPARFDVLENGVKFELSFNEGYSAGLFLDQRDNRRRFLVNHVAAGFPLFKSEIRSPKSEILNCFAYTCGFSVCAALAGARTTNLDLSKKYLEWGKRNFGLNGLDSTEHDFIYGDVFDWLRRLAKQGRKFDAVILDPPTFSQSKASGRFRAEKDYGKLVAVALPLIKPGGVLFASTNAAAWPPEKFLASVRTAIRGAKRRISQEHYFPQPPDFSISRAEPAYLKAVWMRIE